MARLKSHLFADVFPLLEAPALAALASDIQAHGLHEPIWTYEGTVLDGRQRAERNPLKRT